MNALRTTLACFAIALVFLPISSHAACHNPFSPEGLQREQSASYPVFDPSGKQVDAIDIAQARLLAKIQRRLEAVVGNIIPVFICLAETWDNARATAEDTVETTTTFLKRIGADEDIAAMVIAHEYAHIMDRHIVHQAGYDRNAVRAAILAAAQANQSGGRITLGTARLWVVSQQNYYSRELELQADQHGLDYAIEAGFNPWRSIRLYTDILRQTDRDETQSTHPSTERRIARLMALYAEQLKIGKYKEQAEEQKGQNEKFAIVVEPLIAKGRWKNADSVVNGWIKEMPESGMAWYYKGQILSKMNPKERLGVEAFEKAVIYDPESQDAWFALCMSLPAFDHRLESAYCSKHLSRHAQDQDQIEQHKKQVFNGVLVIGGRDPRTQSVLISRDEFGKKLFTNDESLLKVNGRSVQKSPPWWGLRDR